MNLKNMLIDFYAMVYSERVNKENADILQSNKHLYIQKLGTVDLAKQLFASVNQIFGQYCSYTLTEGPRLSSIPSS